MIYFLGTGEAVKIGFTDQQPKSRLNACQTGNHLEITLLGVMAGSISDESVLHKKFSDLHIRGEWFRPGDDLMRFIADNTMLLPDYDKELFVVNHKVWQDYSDEECTELWRRRIEDLETDTELAKSLSMSVFDFMLLYTRFANRMVDKLRRNRR